MTTASYIRMIQLLDRLQAAIEARRWPLCWLLIAELKEIE